MKTNDLLKKKPPKHYYFFFKGPLNANDPYKAQQPTVTPDIATLSSGSRHVGEEPGSGFDSNGSYSPKL